MSVGIIFIAYALQVKYQPFLPPNNDLLDDKAALSSGMALVYVGWLELAIGLGFAALCVCARCDALVVVVPVDH